MQAIENVVILGRVRVRASVLLAVVGGVIGCGGSPATAVGEPCTAHCMSVAVPLDRSGKVPGTLRLRVERYRAERPVRPPLLTLSGLPGESSTVSELDSLPMAIRKLLPPKVRREIDRETRAEERGRHIPDFLQSEARARDIVVMDLRGSGNSGLLRCPALERASEALRASRRADAAARCAASLGPRRGLYTARESAEDIEAVRQALGVERIALLGGSYGADVAFHYAQAHPDRVDRLVLDSISAPAGFDGAYLQGLAAFPNAVQVLCRKRRCHRASADPIGDFGSLARRLERGPLEGMVVGPGGRQRKEQVEPFALFAALFEALDGDRNLVGAVRNALRGDVRPLLRYRRQVRFTEQRTQLLSARGFSVAAYAASRCEEAQLPWPRDAGIAARLALADGFLGVLPTGAMGPFGPRTALQSDVVRLCRKWPIASAPQPSPRLLPPIPTLVVTSVEDLRAPLAGARAVANLIPGARLLRLRGAGHEVFGGEGSGSGCAEQVLAKFLRGAVPTDVCGPEYKGYRGAAPPPPLSLAEVRPDRRVAGRAGRTLSAIDATIRDGDALDSSGGVGRSSGRRGGPPRLSWGGLRRGRYTLDLGRWRMGFHDVSYVPGLRLSGWLTYARARSARRGVLYVDGVVRGRLAVHRSMMVGRLAGRPVRAPLRLGPEFGVEATAFSRTATDRARESRQLR
jgi:pimeloyl-ACP methyl ester carboxylesterase